MNLLEILLGQIPEAIYFALFMIFTKRLDKKRGLFITLMVIEYILLFKAFPLSIWARILYFVITYIILKILYREKSQIIDIFTLGIASIILMIISGMCYFVINVTIKNMIICVILSKILLFASLYAISNKLYKIQNMYKKFWNRNDKIPKIIKSTTFRCINVILFNIMFYLINCFILYTIFLYQNV